MQRRNSSSSSIEGSPRSGRTNSSERRNDGQDFAPPNKNTHQSSRGLGRRYSRGGSRQDQLGRGRGRSHDQREDMHLAEAEQQEEDADEFSSTMGSNPSASPSQVSNESDASAHIDLHLAEAERQEEEMDESIYVMESDPSASPSGKREAVASRSSLGLNEETDAGGLISAEGPAVDTNSNAENSGGKSVSEKIAADM